MSPNFKRLWAASLFPSVLVSVLFPPRIHDIIIHINITLKTTPDKTWRVDWGLCCSLFAAGWAVCHKRVHQHRGHLDSLACQAIATRAGMCVKLKTSLYTYRLESIKKILRYLNFKLIAKLTRTPDLLLCNETAQSGDNGTRSVQLTYCDQITLDL